MIAILGSLLSFLHSSIPLMCPCLHCWTERRSECKQFSAKNAHCRILRHAHCTLHIAHCRLQKVNSIGVGNRYQFYFSVRLFLSLSFFLSFCAKCLVPLVDLRLRRLVAGLLFIYHPAQIGQLIAFSFASFLPW